MARRNSLSKAAAALCTLLLFTAVRESSSTCRGHDCDHQHDRAKAAGLLGAVRATVQRPKQCRDSKMYPVEGKLKPQELATPPVNIRWAGKDADIDKVHCWATQGVNTTRTLHTDAAGLHAPAPATASLPEHGFCCCGCSTCLP